MDYISYLSDSDLESLILDTKAELYICMPMLNESIIDTVLKLSEQRPDCSIKIVVDFNPDTFYKGYGDFDTINNFRNLYKKLPHSISQLEGNRVSLIMSDDKGYYLFLQSSYIDSKIIKYNGIKIEKTGFARIKNTLFHELNTPEELQNAINNAIISESKVEITNEDIISAPVEKLKEEKIEKTNQTLEVNPPLKGSIDEVISVYENKLRYIHIKFEGSKFKGKSIHISTDIIELKVDAFKKNIKNVSFPILEEKDAQILNDEFIEIVKLKDKLIKDYTFKVKDVEFSVFYNRDYDKIMEYIKVINDRINKFKNECLIKMQKALDNSKEQIISKLEIEFKSNNGLLSPKELSQFNNNFTELTKHFVENNLKWPNANSLLDKIKFKYTLMEIPISDIYDAEFRKKLVASKVIPNDDISNVSDIQGAMTVK